MFFFLNLTNVPEMSPQDATLQHYMDYSAENLIPVMAHIAKNVVKVNEGLTKHVVSVVKLTLPYWGFPELPGKPHHLMHIIEEHSI